MLKPLRKLLATTLIAGSLFSASTVNAEVKTYTGSDEYVMSEFETIDIAKQRARQKAERNAQEQAGVYISSYSETRDMELVSDEIVTIACGIMSVVDVKYDVQPLADVNGFVIRATVTANIDTDDVNKWLQKGAQEKSAIVARNQELQRAVDEQASTIENLKSQIAKLKADGKLNGQRERETVTAEFAAEDKIFQANLKVEESLKSFINRDFESAIKLCNEALQLNPTNVDAHVNRGAAYGELRNFTAALADFNKAIELNPNHAAAYNGRGTAYLNQRQHEQAIADYTKALQLNPNFTIAYYNRGWAYDELNQYERAIADYTKAIQLNPNFVDAYTNRGTAYAKARRFEQAIQDFSKAIELNPNDDMAYHNRGVCYRALGNTAQAQADLNQARALGYNG